ncbi:hypothetical protein [Rhizobium sp. LC145]|uniref:hypothetical protein n=1 Tax=Rhizobium sp. LC145 TaxID=1120688 RepID=UPI00062A4C5A|nr:hypothetical protein [Rhizobium sp. LC145]KKX29217.1 hypothetical protein YH62_15570 [Rhizobium sp. LC145]TKT68817.1 hypothetical protein FDR95_00105 [Rhizobiaceae bacterium LC148]
MPTVPDFIAELVRAANEVEKLDDFGKRRLLERAVTTIRDMRETVGIPQNQTARDVVIDLQTTAWAIEKGIRTDEDVKSALLEAAGMIRDLYIVVDTGTEIAFDGGTTHEGED